MVCQALLVTFLAAGLTLGIHAGSSFVAVSSLLASVAVFALWQPSWSYAGLSLLLATVIGWIYWMLGGTWTGGTLANIAAGGAFLGAGNLAAISLAWLWCVPADRANLGNRFRHAALMPAFCFSADLVLGTAAALTPLTNDPLLLASDLQFGLAPSWLMGRAFASWAALRLVSVAAYWSLPCMVALCMAMEERNVMKAGSFLKRKFALLAVAGVALYQICPAVGPYVAFARDFPHTVPGLSGVAAMPLPPFERNCLPSLHLAAVLLLLWNLRRTRPWFVLFLAAYSLATVAATMGMGQHYFVDLIPSAPLALAIESVCLADRKTLRWAAFAWGASLTMVWILAIRLHVVASLANPALLWSAAGLTVASSVALAFALERVRPKDIQWADASVPGALTVEYR